MLDRSQLRISLAAERRQNAARRNFSLAKQFRCNLTRFSIIITTQLLINVVDSYLLLFVSNYATA